MNLDRLAVVMAIAFAFATDASAATACIQNKSTGLYEPKTPTKENAADCAAMNSSGAAAIVRPLAPPAAAPVPSAGADSDTPTKVLAGTGASRAVVPIELPAKEAVQPADPAQQIRTYRVKTSDVTVRLAMKRWLKEINMQLAYEASEEFRADVEGDYTGTIPDVLFQLMTSVKQTKYPLRSCEYNNRVVLVVHRDDVCPLEDE